MEPTIDPKLTSLRELISTNKLDGYILPRTDPHSSEYLPKWEERVKFISGFSGSNGLVYVS